MQVIIILNHGNIHVIITSHHFRHSVWIAIIKRQCKLLLLDESKKVLLLKYIYKYTGLDCWMLEQTTSTSRTPRMPIRYLQRITVTEIICWWDYWQVLADRGSLIPIITLLDNKSNSICELTFQQTEQSFHVLNLIFQFPHRFHDITEFLVLSNQLIHTPDIRIYHITGRE